MSDSEASESSSASQKGKSNVSPALSDLRVKRGVIIGQQTKMKGYADKFTQPVNVVELQVKLELLDNYFGRFNEVQMQIEALDESERNGDKREQYEDTFCFIKAKLTSFLPPRNNSNANLDNSLHLISSLRPRTSHLPRLQLTQFSGDYTEWPNFSSMFNTLVHDDDSLVNIEKFQLLRSALKGSALRVIDSLEMSSQNYNIALKMLKERFDNKRLIFQTHIKEIFCLREIKTQSVDQLRALSDSVNAHYRALLSIGSKDQIGEGLLLHIVDSKLDETTRAKWEDEAPLNEIPTWEQMSSFIEKQCQRREHLCSSTQKHTTSKTSSRKTSMVVSQDKCIYPGCGSDKHKLPACSQFMEKTPSDRLNVVKQLRLCINCLRPGHMLKDCKSSHCRHCGNKHNTLLHLKNMESQKLTTIAIPSTSSSFEPSLLKVESSNESHNVSLIASNKGHVFIATAIVEIQNKFGQFMKCRALLDSASQLNFATERLAQQLQTKRVRVDSTISGIGSTNTRVKFKSELTLRSCHNNFVTNIETFILPKITELQPDRIVDTIDWNIPKNINLADPSFNQPQRADLLIGAELFFDLLCVGQIKLGNNYPTLQKTLLGWIVSGIFRTSSSTASCHIATSLTSLVSEDPLDPLIRQFWQIEDHESSTQKLTADEEYCETHFIDTHQRLPSGRFSVQLPFREQPELLGNSYHIAKKRFLNLERRLHQTPILEPYSKFIKEYLDLHHMELVEPTSMIPLPRIHYLPHHAVLKPESSTTKLRVVFDGSCKTESGYSLNSILRVGPIVQPELLTILLRFRLYRYALTADISKMYRQIRVMDPDNYLQCILWRESPERPLSTYRLLTVTYGTSSASFLATRVLQQLAIEENETFPKGSSVVQNNFYVDDMLAGADSTSELFQIKNEVIGLLRKGGFTLSKWCSNHEEVIDSIDASQREKFMSIEENLNAIKTLGMSWNPSRDEFNFVNAASDHSNKITKRNVLSSIARLFDPLGLINPVVVKAKIFMQQLWSLKVDWDESLPLSLQSEWLKFIKELHHIREVKIPRFIFSRTVTIELHGFADASMNAYGACIYVRLTDQTATNISNLLIAKSRVAPLKTISIPRLELCAALLLVELLSRTQASLQTIVSACYCWSDSQIVLAWISSPSSKFTTFVSNRVSKIQQLSNDVQWNHVGTKENPADLLSRGAWPSDLVRNSLWLHGPEFLAKPKQFWPKHKAEDLQNLPEERTVKTSLLASPDPDLIQLCTHCNSFQKLRRIFAYINRFIHNSQPYKPVKLCGPLNAEELESGLQLMVKVVQQTSFHFEISQIKIGNNKKVKGPLNNLNPFIDSNGIVRVGGRLQNSNMDYDAQHQIILPKSHCFTTAVINFYHRKNLHAGAQTLLAIIRTRFWPIGGKTTIKRVIRSCIICFRSRPISIHQLMGNLPEARVPPSHPFTHTGLDLCGHFFITNLIRGRPPSKVYLCIYVCFSTKALHLELVSNLTSEAFIGSLKRFIARRGRPTKLYSDNGTNFVGASRQLSELKELFQTQLHIDSLAEFGSEEGINWEFIPPRSPHFGGLWEASVKLAKYHLKRVAANASLSFEELHTLVCQVEATINSRPLTPISDDPADLNALTPGHFLIHGPLNAIPEPCILNININRLSRWQRVTQAYQHFWQRWSKEYLHSLQSRYKWKFATNPVKVGDLVLLKDENTPPTKWNLGRIHETHSGQDGFIRVVTLKTAKGITRRAITKICPLPQDENEGHHPTQSN